MRQYLEVKAQHPESILLFRVGDFHEIFFEDAVKASQLLDLTLTTRDKGKSDAVPMCGVPYHATRGYIARLTELGEKVVLVEQTEDPKQAKGLVRREVVQIITPGVVLDDEVLDPKSARYVAAVTVRGKRRAERYGLAYLDASTGEFRATELDDMEGLVGELTRAAPREVLIDEKAEAGLLAGLPGRYACAYTTVQTCSVKDASALLESALPATLKELGLADKPLAACAAADALGYARATQPTGVLPMSRLHVYEPGEGVVLDEAAVANLELVATLMNGKRKGSLLSVIDTTRTSPGSRLMRRWLLYPLGDVPQIRRRQDSVEHLIEHAALRTSVRGELAGVADLERLAGRISLGVATPRDLAKLRDSLAQVPVLAQLIADDSSISLPALLELDATLLDKLAAILADLAAALVDEPPPIRKDGGYIRDGYCATVDENRRLADGGKDQLLAIEAREREATGIHNLKVKYNRVFGYYIEVTKSQLARVPKQYVRKQTIANGERYITEELGTLESKILAAQEALIIRENELFETLCKSLAAHTSVLGEAGARLAAIDCLASLAEVAHLNDYVRPVVDDGLVLDIVDGRHPVVEQTVAAGAFVPNDCRLDPNAEQVLLITGPNMAGKSTYMRQVAHIVLLGQMGSFVPARSAQIGLADRIFTRVGAADNLARGESTFMVEMRETAAILSGATRRSLVVLDEVGRGTSTFDGVSIAWAVTEFLHDAIGARTLFATHYHELCSLANARPRVRNFSVAVRELAGEIVFLRQVVPGGANRSYGIEVGKLAGLPRTVVSRARQILGQLEGGRDLGHGSQLALFAAAQSAPPPQGEGEHEVVQQLRDVDPNNMTPLEALTLLAELRAQVS